MSRPFPTDGIDVAPRPSLLIVTTVASTMSFILPYVRHFRAMGWRVDGCARGITRHPASMSTFDSVFELPLSRSVRDVRGMATSLSVLAEILAQGYDIVHVHTPIAAFVTRAVARRLPAWERPRIVYTAHGFHFHRQGQRLTNAIFRTAERVAGRWTDRLVVINEEDLAAARLYRIVPEHRLRHMHGIGVDTEWYSPASVSPEASRAALAEVGMEPGRPFFVAAGELNRNKRPTDIVMALANMRDREPALLFLGDGPERLNVERLAIDLGVARRVVLSPSFVPDVRPYIRAAMALILASKREGLPRTIMEALSLEVPVIASAARGCPELVGRDRGEVVPIGATLEMAAAMDRLAGAPEERFAMGRRGRQLMTERYGLPQLIAEHEALYAGLLVEDRGRGQSERA